MTVPMSVLVPIDITDARLTSSTVAEPGTGEVLWVAAATYAIDEVVIRPTTHRRYSCLAAGVNAGLPEVTPLRWYDLGPTNRQAMIDGETSTQTVAASPATIVLHPGPANSAYLAGLDGDSLTVLVKSSPGGPTIFNRTYSLEGSAPADYYEYFFDPFKPLRDILVSGFEPYSDAELSFTLTSSGGAVKCAVLAVGDLKPLGQTISGARAKPKSYGRVTTDVDGITRIKRGKKAKDISATALVDIEEANRVIEIITDLLDIPCVLVCTDAVNYAGLRNYGLLSGDLEYSSTSKIPLSINSIGIV
jgi:hypothetical protein